MERIFKLCQAREMINDIKIILKDKNVYLIDIEKLNELSEKIKCNIELLFEERSRK